MQPHYLWHYFPIFIPLCSLRTFSRPTLNKWFSKHFVNQFLFNHVKSSVEVFLQLFRLNAYHTTSLGHYLYFRTINWILMLPVLVIGQGYAQLLWKGSSPGQAHHLTCQCAPVHTLQNIAQCAMCMQKILIRKNIPPPKTLYLVLSRF